VPRSFRLYWLLLVALERTSISLTSLIRKAWEGLEAIQGLAAEHERLRKLLSMPGRKSALPRTHQVIQIQKIHWSQRNLRTLLPQYGVLEQHDLVHGIDRQRGIENC
jgi:hypothetical protein